MMDTKEMTRLYHRAYLRDRVSGIEYTDDAMLLAMLAHTHGVRDSADMETVLKLMLDINVTE